MDRAVFSPCPLCPDSSAPPLWQISARRVIHDQVAQNVIYHHAFFYLGVVPVLYTPYFYHPYPTFKLRSGFLVPQFGSDNLLGLSVQVPYYFALAPNCVTPASSASFHSTPPSGYSGEPSYRTTPAPDARPLTSQFHIIHPVVVK